MKLINELTHESTLGSEQEMIRFAMRCAPYISAGQCVFLEGNLGVGKTTLAKGLLRAWGYDELVTSPTFSLLETYALDKFDVHHFDLYRIQSAEELEMIGARELFNSASICLVEWPEKAQGNLPQAAFQFLVSHQTAARKIIVKGKHAKELVNSLDSFKEYD